MNVCYLAAGDFNIHNEDSVNDSVKTTFLSIIDSYNASLVIKTPTRFNSCIGHIITNIENVLGYTEPVHISDQDSYKVI